MHHRNYSDDFYDFTLPSFLEQNVDINDNTLVIELGEGNYTLDFNILIHQHNVIIKGKGSSKTFLNVPENVDYIDDAIINLQGEWNHEIAVKICGLTINAIVTKTQAQSASYHLTQSYSYIFKCYHVKSFYMHDVKITTENLNTTCIDIRRGSNIKIHGNEFFNYNRRWEGGGIWLRGDIENVTIEDNDFFKYGNDEVIGLYGSNNFAGVNTSDEISKKNIEIRYNRFYCQDGGENSEGIINETGDRGIWHGCNERFITVYTNQDDNKERDPNNSNVLVQRATPCHQTINGIHLLNNEFYINAPVSHLFTVAFDKYTIFKDVSASNNIIDYGNWTINGNSSNKQELKDFGIYYDTPYDSYVLDGNYDGLSDEPFFIKGNTITCGTNIRNFHTSGGNQYYADNHMIVDIIGTKVIFDDNTVICTREAYTPDEKSYANKGVDLFRFGKGGEVEFSNNHCEGLKMLLGSTSGSAPIIIGKIWGNGNYLQGNPRFIYVNTLESYLFMTNNEIISDYPIFFLEEFANTGTAIFKGNRVYRDLSRVLYFTTPYGHIYYTGNSGSGNNIQSMKLICCNNIFDNMPQNSMYTYLQSSIKNIHKNNIFSDMTE